MSRRQRPAFADRYILRRLQEQSWEETDEQMFKQATVKDSHGSGAAFSAGSCDFDSTKSRPCRSFGAKSQGHTQHSGSSSTRRTHLRRDSGRDPIPSQQTQHEPLLEKRYHFSSVSPATSIPNTTATSGRRCVHNVPRSSSSSCAQTQHQRVFRKVRNDYTTKSTAPSQVSSRRSSLVGVVNRGATKATSTSHRVPVSASFTLPRVGQRSSSGTNHSSEEANSRWRKKPCNYNRPQSDKLFCQSNRIDGFRINTARSHDTNCDHDTVRMNNRLRKSASVGAMGVDKMWGGVGVKEWRGGECCCEDVEEELGMSVTGDTMSIEDATDESVLEEGGESGEEEGEGERRYGGNEWEMAEREEKGAGGSEGGGGFSEEDLTDLEDEGYEVSGTSSRVNEECPPPSEVDPVTHTLLLEASQQLEQLLIDHSIPTSRSCSTKHDKFCLKYDHQVTKSDKSELTLTATNHRLLRKETEVQDTSYIAKQPHVVIASTLSHSEIRSNPSLPSPPLTPSFFPGLEPTIHFPMPDEPYTLLPPALRSQLKWKMSTITPNVIKHCISRAGFTPCSKGSGWLGYWGKHMRSQAFRGIRGHQKVNHFPGSFEIGRKDRLWRNLSKMQSRVGKKLLNFVPLTFVLPHDLRLLKREWERGETRKQKWILKPPAAARGIGVRVIHRWNQIPKKRPIIVQRYISDPLLINGCKFDLRVYVYISSYDPLKIYVFRDGLARFATCKYSSSTRSLSNRFVHITNYSVNKKNTQFSQNPYESQCQGHKWGLLALWKYMRDELDFDTDTIWESIKEIVVKTIICSEPYCSSLVKAYVQRSYSCHELFGFDVMLDRKLKPWIIEVNISPSLHSNSQLDVNIKGRMIRDLLNIAGFQLPHSGQPMERGLQSQYSALTVEERQKHSHFLQRNLPEYERKNILDKLTERDVAVLMEAEDEFSRRGMFERVFPSQHSWRYRKYFESEKYYNILLEQWLVKHQLCPERGITVLQKLHSHNNKQY